MRGQWRSTAAGAGLAVIAGVSLTLSSWFGGHSPRESVPTRCATSSGAVPDGRVLKLMVWNIQFSGGRSGEFFYDGGQKVHSEEAEVRHTLERIAQEIRDQDPDIVVLQEVDRDSRRSAYIDQLNELVALTGLPCQASTPYHRVAYVPHPEHEHLGRVNMHLSVLSRFRLDDATRHQLALLDEPAWRQAFNLRRALLDVRLPLTDGRELAILNTHLSAFSKGDGTLGRQVAQIKAHLQDLDKQGIPWVLAGDFNALHPGDDRSRLPADDQAWYAEATTPIAPLFDAFSPAVTQAALDQDPAPFFTYAPFGADKPDRVLDYIFYSSGVQPDFFDVISGHTDTSDHLPMVFRFRL